MSSVSDYKLRQATLADVESIVALVNRAFEIEKFFKAGDRTDARQVAAMMRLGKILLLTSADQVVAVVFVKVKGDRMYAGLLAADPQWRVTGTGPV